MSLSDDMIPAESLKRRLVWRGFRIGLAALWGVILTPLVGYGAFTLLQRAYDAALDFFSIETGLARLPAYIAAVTIALLVTFIHVMLVINDAKRLSAVTAKIDEFNRAPTA